jgi:hypothetical protein
VGAFARIVEVPFRDLLCLRILHNEDALHEVAPPESPAVGEITVEQGLTPGDYGLLPFPLDPSDLLPLAPVEFVPVLVCSADRETIDLPVHVTVHLRAPLDAFGLPEHRPGLAASGVKGDDLTGRVAHPKVDPSGGVGGDGALVLHPVLLVHVPVVPERTAPGVERYHAAIRIRDRPDEAIVVLGHAHGHPRCGLVNEGECPLLGVKLHEVVVEMGVEFVVARKDGGVGTVTAGRKGHREFLALSGLGVDHQKGIAAAMVEQPD